MTSREISPLLQKPWKWGFCRVCLCTVPAEILLRELPSLQDSLGPLAFHSLSYEDACAQMATWIIIARAYEERMLTCTHMVPLNATTFSEHATATADQAAKRAGADKPHRGQDNAGKAKRKAQTRGRAEVSGTIPRATRRVQFATIPTGKISRFTYNTNVSKRHVQHRG